MLAPKLAMVWAMEDEDPRPISIMAMTAAMPIMIPRQVNTDRMTFRRSACKAIRTVRVADFMTLFANRFCGAFAMTLRCPQRLIICGTKGFLVLAWADWASSPITTS